MHADDQGLLSSPTVDVVVLGAGISGLVSASILLEQGARSVLVVDSYPQVGGNHLDTRIGDYTFDVGSFIFQDDSPLLRHFPEILDRYLEIDPSWGKLNPQGVITDYPFSLRDDFRAAGAVEITRLLSSAARGRLRRRPLRNARDFAHHWIGRRMSERSGLENYMERFCGRPADQIDLEFARARMMWIAEYSSVRHVARRWAAGRRRRRSGTASPQRVNRQLARPREGFAHLYEPAVARLVSSGVSFALGCEIRSLRRHDPDGLGFHLEYGEHTVRTARVVSTLPIDHTLDVCGIDRPDTLPTVTMISLFMSFRGRRGFDAAILYNFSHEGPWKRLTMYSDFYGAVAGREYFGVEVIAAATLPTIEETADVFAAHCRGYGLFDGDLRFEGGHVLHHAYPLYTRGAAGAADAATTRLRAWGVESFGRQGGFQYQPTARVSALEAEAAVGRPQALTRS